MSHYAKVDDGVVTQVIVATQDFIDTGLVGEPSSWYQTSYNTRNGIHYGPDGTPDGGVALRGNYAGIGYTYDIALDAFLPPKPFASWNLAGYQWEAPTPYPTDGKLYTWNEETTAWDEFVAPTPPG